MVSRVDIAVVVVGFSRDRQRFVGSRVIQAASHASRNDAGNAGHGGVGDHAIDDGFGQRQRSGTVRRIGGAADLSDPRMPKRSVLLNRITARFKVNRATTRFGAVQFAAAMNFAVLVSPDDAARRRTHHAQRVVTRNQRVADETRNGGFTRAFGAADHVEVFGERS